MNKLDLINFEKDIKKIYETGKIRAPIHLSGNNEDILIKKSVKKEYNLDDILDKISEKGVSSLTKEENEYLKNLSK
jgi:hypothetical protein